MIPLGDTPNPRGVPIVNYALIATNIAVYLLFALPLGMTAPDAHDPGLQQYLQVLSEQLPSSRAIHSLLRDMTAYDVFVFVHGFKPRLPELSDLFAGLFMHANLMHLAGNMLFLWIYGDNVEFRLGRARYLLAYLGCGVVATLFHSLFALGSAMPLIGASGAISGVLGFYFKWFPRNKVRMLVFFFPFLMDTIYLPSRLVLGMYFVVDNLLPFVSSSAHGASGVAYGAHIGGFLSGLLLAWLYERTELRGTGVGFDEAPHDIDVTPRSQTLSQQIADGDYRAAAQQYFSLTPAAAGNALAPEASLQLADWLREHGHADAALTVYRRHLRDFPRGPGRAEAHVGAGRVQLESRNETPSAYHHFLDALDSNPSIEAETQARRGLAAIEALQRRR